MDEKLKKLRAIRRSLRKGVSRQTINELNAMKEHGMLTSTIKENDEEYFRMEDPEKIKDQMEEVKFDLDQNKLNEMKRRGMVKEKDESNYELNDKGNNFVKEAIKKEYGNYFPYKKKGYVHFKHEIDIIADSVKKPEMQEALKMAKDQGIVSKTTTDWKDWLGQAKIFDVEDNIKNLLLLTNNEIDGKKPMPFDDIFINCDVEIDGWIYKGILLTNTHPDGIMLMTFTGKTKGEDWPCENALWYDFSKDKVISDLSETLMTDKMKSEAVPVEKRLPNIRKLAMFCMNFLDFLNNPDVQVVEIVRSAKNQERRKKAGKEVLPSSNRVTVRGELKIYMDSICRHLENFHYSHRFWVRGHFMRFRDKEKYARLYSVRDVTKLNRKHVRGDGTVVNLQYSKDADGTIKVWKWPYVKGEGILIDKTYKLQK